MDQNIERLGATLKDLIKGRVGAFIDANRAPKEFLEDRARRMAELTLELARASTDDERASIRGLMETVADSIENELTAVAVLVSAEFRAAVTATLSTMLEFAQKALPIVLKAVAAV